MLSNDMDASTIIDIVKEAYPNAKGKDSWFWTFIKDVIKRAFEKPPTPPPVETAANETNRDAADPAAEEQPVSQDVPLGKILLQGALEVYREKMEALAAEAASKSASRAPEVVTADGVWGLDAAKKAAELVPEPEAVPVRSDENLWGFSTSWKDKKKGKYAVVEPEPERVPEPEPIEEPPAEPEPEPEATKDDSWAELGAITNKKDKKKGEVKNAVVEPDPELEPLCKEPSAEPEPEQIKVDLWAKWSAATSKKDKKKKGMKGAKAELVEPVKAEEPEEPEEPVKPTAELKAATDLTASPVEKDWVGVDPDQWAFGGATKSPWLSM